MIWGLRLVFPLGFGVCLGFGIQAMGLRLGFEQALLGCWLSSGDSKML